MRPDWLPDKLSLAGNMPDLYRSLNAFYQAEIENEPIMIEGVPVIHNTFLDPKSPPYTHGFIHLVTREIVDAREKIRVFDPTRAEKLSWVVPILKNYKEPEVSCFWYETPEGVNVIESLAIWLEEMDYILILKWENISRTTKVVVTAHTVDRGNRGYWQRKRRRPTSRIL